MCWTCWPRGSGSALKDTLHLAIQVACLHLRIDISAIFISISPAGRLSQRLVQARNAQEWRAPIGGSNFHNEFSGWKANYA